jgi:hypothetical protein
MTVELGRAVRLSAGEEVGQGQDERGFAGAGAGAGAGVGEVSAVGAGELPGDVEAQAVDASGHAPRMAARFNAQA